MHDSSHGGASAAFEFNVGLDVSQEFEIVAPSFLSPHLKIFTNVDAFANNAPSLMIFARNVMGRNAFSLGINLDKIIELCIHAGTHDEFVTVETGFTVDPVSGIKYGCDAFALVEVICGV